ncbi:MAG TPA: FixH family protein [Acidobacteriaceae bacterium]|jgi:Cu(I)/Ag(I) efflux system membrane fusion protein/cobalt-zinc-cadmium efflux system membrane fusion protein|nr:FixH family protein [Acidobacteriaceae bacterium]
MNDRSYRSAFLAALVLCVLLAGALAWALLHRGRPAPVEDPSDPVVAEGPAPANRAPAANLGSNPAPAQNGPDPALAPLQIAPERLQQIGVTTAVAQISDVHQQLQAPGNVDIDEERLAWVQTRFPGWIQNVFANATWQFVRKGQRLFTIYSPELVSTEQEYLLAKQNQKAFTTSMHTESPTTLTAAAVGTATEESGWLVQAAEERLRQFDVPPAEVARLVQSGKVQREIAIVSPASGYITERNALPNAYVQPDTKLYTIADLSTVWVYANVFQNDVGRLKPGDPAEVTVDSYPGRTFRGRIDQILPDVDPTTRTVRVRLVFGNPGVALKPGMYVSVNIDVPLGRQLVIPSAGVLQAGTREIAFLDHGLGHLEPRVVQTGPQIGDSVVVLKGLQAGDRIVSSANFLVDSEAQLQSVLGSFSPPPQSGAPGSGAAQSIRIDYSLDPSPPRKGANTVRVHLTAPDGKPVTGAQVTATFFLAAMPAMGMGAMRASAPLAEQGEGIYSGPLQLGSGGTWQMTIAVVRNGQTIASQQFSVEATGGMG